MTYRALYRVWRPQRFDQLVGQDAIAQTLRNALRQNRLSHAYLFTGGRGTGKTSTAKILAKAVNCLDLQDGEPCNACAHCLAIMEDRYMDVIEIDAASNRGIDEMRQLKENVQFAPSQGGKKVFIIDEVHMLTTEAFNALLKTLEEPPAHVLFILATTDPQKIPATILSRTQRFDFRRISTQAIADHLATVAENEGIAIRQDAIDLIAQASDGGLRDAVSLLDQAASFSQETVDIDLIAKLLGRPSRQAMAHLLEAMAQKDYPALFQAGQQAMSEAGDPASFLRAFTSQLHALMRQSVLKNGKDLPADLAAFTLPKLEALLSRSLEAEADLKRLPDGDLIAETTLFAMTRILHEPTTADKAPAQAPSRQPTGRPTATAPASAPAPSQAPNPPAQAKSNPASKAPPAPASPAPGPSQAVPISEAWEAIMNHVKDASVRTHALLRQAYPRGVQDKVLTLSFAQDSQFHYRQMKEPAQQECLLKAVHAVLGPGHQVDLLLEEEASPSPAEDAPAPDLVQTTKDIFGDVPLEIAPTPNPFDPS